jgi:hypothetical protein
LASSLAGRAAVGADAHHVKYTLACLRTAAADPPARRLFLAAAAHLGAWWVQHPISDDPLAGQATIQDGLTDGVTRIPGVPRRVRP